ncbi:OmcA/MtrC family decaheme c-type cytochrome [Aeromonas cavernicola]|uniref:Cytochrome C n=1 Tax=Aeromonas cavernicola TaxID=1006623 RepID=A0A2H9U0L4_9GAMM|nr:OmcA/MtrC family decaheme c-type cytochrome [Aeromonas cavernicola]PJG57550.1 cytochrome C [Aeromonas cavernicola]
MKLWKVALTTALLVMLSACGGGEGNEQTAPPVAPSEVNRLTLSADTPQLSEGGKLSVRFKVTTPQGQGYDLGTIVPNFTLAKLVPGRDSARQELPLWKSYIYLSNSRYTNRPGPDNKGALEALGNGQYRYTFSFDVTQVSDPFPADSADNNGMIRWDEQALHRIVIYFGGSDGVPVAEQVISWVPAGTAPTLSNDLVTKQTCDGCHMGKPSRHANRTDPKGCTTCHNDSVPGNGRASLLTLVHKLHGNQDPTATSLVSHFPQDSRNCDTCHKGVSPATPDGDKWTFAQEKPCGACHADSATASTYVQHIDNQINNGRLCTQCHAEQPDNVRSPTNAHLGRMANEAVGRDKLQWQISDLRYAAPNIEVVLNVTANGVPAETMAQVLPYVKFGDANRAPYVLVNWDKGDGFELGYTNPQTFVNRNRIDFPQCEAQGGGQFLCRKEVEGEVSGTLAATIAELQVCVARSADRNGAFAAGDLLPCSSTASSLSYVAINPVKAYYRVEGGVDNRYVLKVGADLASCNGCHKDLAAHTAGNAGAAHAAKDFAQCTSCHNATRTSFYPGIPGDLKYHVHSYHAYGPHRGGEAVFPGQLNNCEACHTKEQYNLPNQQNARPSLAATTADNKQPKFFSPTLVVCASCHLASPLGLVKPDSPAAGDEWASHMKNNGAVFGAATREEVTGVEQCASCHAVGQEQGVDKVHKVYNFR